MKNYEKTAADLRRFGLVMAAPLALIGGFLLWRERSAAPWVLGIGAAFLLLGWWRRGCCGRWSGDGWRSR
jgi:hypothetical protein